MRAHNRSGYCIQNKPRYTSIFEMIEVRYESIAALIQLTLKPCFLV